MLEEVVAVILYTGPMYLKVSSLLLFRVDFETPLRESSNRLELERSPSPLSRFHGIPRLLQYNNVLRYFSGNAFLQKQCVYYRLGEIQENGKFEWTLAPTKYATTIHAIK